MTSWWLQGFEGVSDGKEEAKARQEEPKTSEAAP
jgi:hypothetical protein